MFYRWNLPKSLIPVPHRQVNHISNCSRYMQGHLLSTEGRVSQGIVTPNDPTGLKNKLHFTKSNIEHQLQDPELSLLSEPNIVYAIYNVHHFPSKIFVLVVMYDRIAIGPHNLNNVSHYSHKTISFLRFLPWSLGFLLGRPTIRKGQNIVFEARRDDRSSAPRHTCRRWHDGWRCYRSSAAGCYGCLACWCNWSGGSRVDTFNWLLTVFVFDLKVKYLQGQI